MKTKIAFGISILLVYLLPAHLAAQDREKIYGVMGEGKYYFIYVDDYLEGSEVIHPITPRTFYLETQRKGLISADLSFTDFLQQSDACVTAMLDNSQENIVASIRKAASGNSQNTNAQSDFIPEPLPDQFQGSDQPGNTSTEAVITGVEDQYAPERSTMNGEEELTTYTQVRQKIPWIVQVMLMDEEIIKERQQAQTENSGYFSDMNEEKRERLRNLVNELLTYQDDAIQKQYGRLFPGMNGKIYGSSDAELDELIQLLLNMKEDFLASSEPQLHQIFQEMEILAMGGNK